jgi:hypothetical protein
MRPRTPQRFLLVAAFLTVALVTSPLWLRLPTAAFAAAAITFCVLAFVQFVRTGRF